MKLCPLTLRFFWYLFPWRMPCVHQWHPGLAGISKPVRYCSRCKVIEEMAEADFYAQFGRMPII